MSKNIVKIVLTGGPCAGKTTAIGKISERLSDAGYKVIVIAETPTEIFLSGVGIGENGLSCVDFQYAVLKLQIEKEKLYEEIALRLPQEKILIVCDRGCADGNAYCSSEEFRGLLDIMGTNNVAIRDGYDAVFHLKTAADGAEEFYTTANNSARSETLEQARIIDSNTIDAWVGHPHFRIIDNSTDFDAKINRLLTEIRIVLGLPIPVENERKFLVAMPDISFLLSNFHSKKINIAQTYIKPEKGEDERRIRQRGEDDNYLYYLTSKRKLTKGKRIETERQIKQKEYLSMLLYADKKRNQIIKKRYCFVYNNLYFELDIYPFWQKQSILEIELTVENQEIELPPFLNIIEEVTGDDNYKNSSLAILVPEELV